MARAPKKIETEADDDTPRYRAMSKSFVGHSVVEEGGEVSYEGDEVSENLSPVNAAAQAVVDAQKAPHPDKSTGDKPVSPRRRADAAAAGVGDEASQGDEELA